MKTFFDCEFIEDGKTIELISIGFVREDGAELYLEVDDVNWNKADQWVLDNVKAHLEGTNKRSRQYIAYAIQQFVGNEPEFWSYFADYDWVVLCQLYGRMVDLPKGWPMYCRDLKQMMDERAPGVRFTPPKQEHHALSDARWVRDVHKTLMALAEKED